MQDFPRADRVVRPYGGKWEIGTGSPENRHKTAVSCGPMPTSARPGAKWKTGTALLCPPPIKQKILPSQRAESRGTRVSAILRGATQVQRTRVLPFPALTGRSPVISAVVRLIHMLGGCPSRSVPQEPLSKTAPSLTGTRRYCFRVIADEIFQRIERFVRSIMRQSRSPRCKPRISISAEARLVAHGTL